MKKPIQNPKIEPSYVDEKGKEIKEFALIKIFHFVGARRKKHFMYKWVKLIDYKGSKHWVALHLNDDSGDYFHLRTLPNQNRKLIGVEIVQEPYV